MITHPINTLMTIPCVVDHCDPGPVDEYGNHPNSVVTSTDERCWLAQSARGEEDFVETERWNIYLPPTVTLDANDVIHVMGGDFYVLGAPWKVLDPLTTMPTHIEATVIRRI